MRAVVVFDRRAPAGREWGYAREGVSHTLGGFGTREEALAAAKAAGYEVFEWFGKGEREQ